MNERSPIISVAISICCPQCGHTVEIKRDAEVPKSPVEYREQDIDISSWYHLVLKCIFYDMGQQSMAKALGAWRDNE